MKKIKLLTSLVALLAVTTVTACHDKGGKSASSNIDSSIADTSAPVSPSSSSVAPSSSKDSSVAPSSSSSSSSSAAPVYSLGRVDEKHEFTLFKQNKGKDSSNDDGFYDHDQSFKVGDDNAFNVKPELTVVDDLFLPVEHEWDYDFTIGATLNGEAAGNEYFSVVDARKCDVKFTEAAVGKTFVISVAPGGVTEAQAASFKKTIEVEVVDGYNVYDAKELGYFDTREKDSTVDAPTMENEQLWQCKWYDFKEANNLNPTYTPASLIFQTNITVTTEDLPSNFFYTAQEAQALGDAKAAGSLVDYSYLYLYSGSGNITVDGNYFSLDFTTIPLIKRERAKTTAEGDVVGHAAIFKSISGGDIKFQNINMSGNARNAINDGDRPLSGGLIFVKGAGAETFTASNIIATKFYISFFGEEPFTAGGNLTVFNLNNTKCYNNYNSFLYNWGSTMNISNSLFKGCGGPVIIQDHTSTDDYEQERGTIVLGNAPKTNFVDCAFENYVTGDEAWFQQFGATATSGLIKQMGDLMLLTALPKTFVTNKDHEGKSYQALSAAEQPAFFNFIALNKSGSVEGMSSVPACGTVNVVEGEKANTFDYYQPANNSVYQANVAYQTAVATGAAPEVQAELKQALIAAAIAKGIEFAEDFSDAEDKITEYLTDYVTQHEMLRGLNSNDPSAPVFDLGDGFRLLSYDGRNSYLQLASTVVAESMGGEPAQFVPTQDQVKALPNYMAIYYSGMALTVQLADFVA